MPSSKKLISCMPQDERRREVADIYAAANKGTNHFVNKEGSLVTSIPLESDDIRRLARLERSVKMRTGRRNRVNQIFAELSTPQFQSARTLLAEDHLAQRWLCSKSRLQKWRSAGRGPAYLKIGRRILYRLADIEEFEQKQLVNLTATKRDR
jgi:Helix-turn-helix domain